ncbi:MAG TPA: YicC family protein, partial [Oscillospiraceae bacterium]|nr:YicC family protein [Oscillospiraceae bacterium]
LPRTYLFAEDAVRSRVQRAIGRGKVDVFVSVEHGEGSDVHISLNRPVAEGYLEIVRAIEKEYGLRSDLTAAALSRFPDVFRVEREETDADTMTRDLCVVTEEAVTAFNAMRAREGSRLAGDLLGKLDNLAALAETVAARSPVTVAEYRARLEQRMRDVLADTNIDEGRILMEAALFADKTAVDEELVRLESHFSQVRGLLAAGGTVGRKLDFLVQELNREVNTIGSKGNDLEIARLVVEMKAEIEKVREQVQNLE